MVSLSSRAGAWAQRIGPRLPMTIGPIGVAAGLLLWTRVGVGATYVEAVLPGAVVFGLGLACTVAPLTATIMASADGEHLGAASGVNNAIARLAGLLAVTILPIVVSLDVSAPPAAIDTAVNEAMVISAAVALLGGLVAFLTVRKGADVATPTQATVAAQPCGDPCLEHARLAA